MTIVARSTSGSDLLEWRYRIEGGANVVFYYVGDDPKYIGKILRIRKPVDTENDNIMNFYPKIFTDTSSDYEAIYFFKNSGYISTTYSLHLDDLLRICSSISAMEHILPRPSNRKTDHPNIISLNPSNTIAYIMEDVMVAFDCGIGDVISVELKPKWPYEPETDYNGWCITCLDRLMQTNVSIDNYNTLDYCSAYLFLNHKDCNSFYYAMERLLQSQRYSRYFVNGEQVNSSIFFENQELYSVFLDIFLESGIIPTIRKAIQDLNCKGIKEIHEIYHRLALHVSNSEMNDIASYMMFRALRDCSIIITLQRLGSSSENKVKDNLFEVRDGSWIVYRIRIVDLDKKSVSKILEYHKRHNARLLKSRELIHGSCFEKF